MIKFKENGFKDLLLNEVDGEKNTLWRIIRNQIAQPIIDKSRLPISEAYELLDSYDDKTLESLLNYLSKDVKNINIEKYIICLDKKEK